MSQIPVPSPLWEAVSDFTQRRVFMDIMGVESAGKTYMALTAPGPIALIHSNEKVQGVVQRHPHMKGKPIRIHKYGFVASNDITDTSQRASPVWTKARGCHQEAISGWARSVILDTGTNFWEMLRLARFGTLNPKGRTDNLYTPVNNEYRSLLSGLYRNQTREPGANLITIHQMGDRWVNKLVAGQMQGFNTGVLERKGFKEIGYMAEVVIQVHKLDGVYHSLIVKGWFNGAVEGMDLTDELMVQMGYSGMNFAAIMGFITETPEEEWAK